MGWNRGQTRYRRRPLLWVCTLPLDLDVLPRTGKLSPDPLVPPSRARDQSFADPLPKSAGSLPRLRSPSRFLTFVVADSR